MIKAKAIENKTQRLMICYEKVFNLNEFDQMIQEVLDQLIQKDCQRVEYLRGRLSLLYELKEGKNWLRKEKIDPFS